MKKNIIRIISLVLVAIMTMSLCSCSENMEEEVIKRASAIPQTKEEIFNYFCKSVEMVKTGKPKVEYGASGKATSPDSENSHVKEAFKTISKLITDGAYKDKGVIVEYGEDNSKVMPDKMFDIKDIKSANILDIDNETSRSYTVVFTIWEESNPTQDDSVFGKVYKIASKEDILAEMKKASEFFTVEDYDSQYKSGTVSAVISKETDKITELHLDKTVVVATEITGQHNFADVGTAPLKFNLEVSEEYKFDWDNPNTSVIE